MVAFLLPSQRKKCLEVGVRSRFELGKVFSKVIAFTPHWHFPTMNMISSSLVMHKLTVHMTTLDILLSLSPSTKGSAKQGTFGSHCPCPSSLPSVSLLTPTPRSSLGFRSQKILHSSRIWILCPLNPSPDWSWPGYLPS